MSLLDAAVDLPRNELPTASYLEVELEPRWCPPAGRYSDFRVLGFGAKAEVFVCRDQITGRRVAYKVLHHRLRNDERERGELIREGRILAGIAHRGVPTLMDLGLDCHGRPFFTMSLVEGPTLREVLDDLRTEESNPDAARMRAADWPMERLVRLVMTAADALAHAHDLSVVHCDVKPDNLVVGADDMLHVVDWGIAQVGGEPWRHALQQFPGTRAMRRGSPLYMSPEQALHADLDCRTDVFSLGAVLYECLALRPATRGKSVTEIVAALPSQEPLPPRTVAPRRRISAELERTCLRALSRTCFDRQSSMRELLFELREHHLDLLVDYERDEPASSAAQGAESSWERAPEWWEMQDTDASV